MGGPMATAEKSIVPQAADDATSAFLSEEGIDDLPNTESRIDLDVWIERRLFVLASIAEQVAHNSAVAARRIQMIRDAFDEQNAVLQRRAAYLESILEQVAIAYPYPPAKTKGSKRALPSGEIGIKRFDAKVVVDDPKAVVAWAHEQKMPLLLRVKYEPDKKMVDDYVFGSGEEIPGTHVEPASEKPYVKAGK